MYGDVSDLESVREKLNSVSPCFCLAKWMHATIHLMNGRTHSCYLPPTHQVLQADVEKDPSALHNTRYKKMQRQKMLRGIRPQECSMCWAVEDLPGKQISDRIIRGTDSWTAPYFDKVRQLPWDANINPAYLEVSFSTKCNFRCSYCSPSVSSAWYEEVKKNGPYQLSSPQHDLAGLKANGLMPIENEDENPYLKAFWRWWPELYPDLKVFRITGGEPLLSEHTFKVLDWIEQNPHPNLELDINSNFGVPEIYFERFFSQIKRIITAGKIKHFKIHTSLDTWGKPAEYIRNGLRLFYFVKNITRYLSEIPNGHLAFMCTFNALSVTAFQEFLDWILELRSQFQNQHRAVDLDLPHLDGPRYQSVRVLPDEYVKKVENLIEYMRGKMGSSNSEPLFRQIEIDKMQRILQWMKVETPEMELAVMRSDFYRFFSEHDRRRNTSFLQSFPEMEKFWQLCKKEAEKMAHITGDQKHGEFTAKPVQ